MIDFQCSSCGKKYSLKDEMAGKQAKCRCGNSIKIPDQTQTSREVVSAQQDGTSLERIVKQPLSRQQEIASIQQIGQACNNCQSPIQSSWRACPVCGQAIGANPQAAAGMQQYQQPPSFYPNQATPQPFVQSGNDSVVKANINQSTNYSVQGTPYSNQQNPFPAHPMAGNFAPHPYGGHQYSGSGIPAIQAGNDSVIKAEINSSTNNYHGQYIANQTTVINESSIGTLVKLFSGGSLDQAEEKIKNLPNNPVEVVAILSQTLREILRESKRKFKSEKGLFNFSQGWKTILLFMFPYGVFFIGSGIPKKRMELCQKILDHLHDLALKQRSNQLVHDVEFIDDKMIEIQGLYGKSKNIEISKVMGRFGFLYCFPTLFIIPMALSQPEGKALLLCPAIAVLITGFLVYFAVSGEEYIEKTIGSITEAVSKFSLKWG